MKLSPLFGAGFASSTAGVCVLMMATYTGGQGMLFQIGVALLIAGVVLVLARVLIVNRGVLDYV